MRHDLRPRWYADAAERHAREHPAPLSEAARAVDDLRDEILDHRFVRRVLGYSLAGLTWLAVRLKRRRA